jgi:peptidoglycan/LPS O-acetylase OafA/YrhL
VAKGHFWLLAHFILLYVDVNWWDNDAIDLFNPVGLCIPRMFVLAGLTISCAYTLPSAASFLRGRDISYGLYLYHMPVIATLASAGLVQYWWLWFAAILIPVSLAALSWIVVEKPCLRLKQRFAAADLASRISADLVESTEVR